LCAAKQLSMPTGKPRPELGLSLNWQRESWALDA